MRFGHHGTTNGESHYEDWCVKIARYRQFTNRIWWCAWAQDIGIGKAEYLSSCASCHGTEAKGDGPVADSLKTRPADLTVLAKNNNGVFPYDMVYQVIDGRGSKVVSHGTREMPVWGYRFGPPEAFRYKKRVLSVIDYLKIIQQK